MRLHNDAAQIDFIRAADELHAKRMTSHLRAPVSLDGYATGVLPRRSSVPFQYSKKHFKLPHSSVAANDKIYQSPFDFIDANAMKTTMRAFDRKVIKYHVAPPSRNPAILVYANAVYCSLFYEASVLNVEPAFSRYISAYATILCAALEDKLEAGLSKLLHSRSYELVAVRYQTEQDYMTGLAQDNPYAAAYWDMIHRQGWRTQECILAVATVLFQTIGKRITTAATDEWFKRRLMASFNSIGYVPPPQLLQYKPQTESLQHANTIMSGCFEFRRYFFQAILGMSQQNSLFGDLCKHTVGLLSFAEMSYVLTIQRFLIDKCLEILNVKEMAGEQANWCCKN